MDKKVDTDELRKELREAMKEEVDAWLNAKFAQFGKWTLGALGTLVFGIFVHFLLKMESYTK